MEDHGLHPAGLFSFSDELEEFNNAVEVQQPFYYMRPGPSYYPHFPYYPYYPGYAYGGGYGGFTGGFWRLNE